MLTKGVRNDEAVDALRPAASLAPDQLAAGHALLADILRTLGDVEESSSEYRRLITMCPEEGMI